MPHEYSEGMDILTGLTGATCLRSSCVPEPAASDRFLTRVRTEGSALDGDRFPGELLFLIEVERAPGLQHPTLNDLGIRLKRCLNQSDSDFASDFGAVTSFPVGGVRN
jgi:hypothetical protein